MTTQFFKMSHTYIFIWGGFGKATDTSYGTTAATDVLCAGPENGVAVHKWVSGATVATASGHHGRVLAASFRPGKDDEFVTCGVKHVKWWTLSGNKLLAKKGLFTKRGNMNAPVERPVFHLIYYLKR